MKILLRVGIIAVFLVGGFVLRDRLGGSPAELKRRMAAMQTK